jgi:hypothetical protein
MSDYDNFEDRLRAMADEISRSVQRMSELDIEGLADRYGVDASNARTFADAAGRWLSDRLSNTEPLFRASPDADPASAPDRAGPEAEARGAGDRDRDRDPASTPGPHPLDLPSAEHGLALSALDSGRWTLRPGTNQLAGTGVGPAPLFTLDLVGELRARDWITADGTLTLVGRHALARWCRTADDQPRPAEPDTRGTGESPSAGLG